jgi:hypothetical protein
MLRLRILYCEDRLPSLLHFASLSSAYVYGKLKIWCLTVKTGRKNKEKQRRGEESRA